MQKVILYKDFALSIFHEAQNNEELKTRLISYPKTSESFQKLHEAFHENKPNNETSNKEKQ